MNMRRLVPAVGGVLLMFGGVGLALAQPPGVAQSLGEKLDGLGRGIRREAREIGESMRRGFETMKTEVNRMNTPARVYSRLHWDRSLNSARIEVHPVKGGGVLLRGTVADEPAREHAVALARDTMDVSEVIDELNVLSITPTPTTTTTGATVIPTPAPTNATAPVSRPLR